MKEIFVAMRKSNIDINHRTSTSSGRGFVSVLQLIFITLKLAGIIQWSWLWVLAPAWISYIVVIIIFIILLWDVIK